jgi:dTDP-4-amino-4,6-dideoxygalactose transaminase
MIPMVDLKRQYGTLKPEITEAIEEVLDSTHFVLGEATAQLEREIAGYHGLSHAMGVGSGTDALLLALDALGIGEGDEVITTPFTFIATAEVVAHVRAIPVFVDIDPDTYNIDVTKIEEKITGRTKAIIPVHLFGHPADMDAICAIAETYNLKIIEDCAQAFGAEYKGKKVGTFGDCGCFSFFPSKNLAAYGDAGMVITDDDTLADTIQMLRNHGTSVQYHHERIGYNSRCDSLQAAIVRVKFRHIDTFNTLRRQNASLYRQNITQTDIVLPSEHDGSTHVYHQFTIRSAHRDSIRKHLAEADIASAIYYPVPLHKQKAFRHLTGGRDTFPISEHCASQVLSLPMFPELGEQEILHICNVINHASS